MYVMFSIPMTLLTIWFAVDTFELIHTHRVVYAAAKAAAVSAATQAQYSVVTAPNGVGFEPDVNIEAATAIANQVFADEEQRAGLNNVVQVVSAQVSYPSPAHAQYTVTVSYTPKGIYAALNILSNLFEHASLSDQPIIWTEAPVASMQGQSVDVGG
ncbi:hypothetical protein [Alicyclobacillus macrosporangiidus]|uniref:hypothetical protein n=1 Tax=Alicyclobacillus macrosporangiidus TaxID=392015 RepID=UPI000945DD1F|nr:hypothetical protein [Alicyclobacillus macrosporangiidus]